MTADNEGSADPPVLTFEESNRLLATNPVAAEARAKGILAHRPLDSGGRYLLGAALGRQRKFDEARRVLDALITAQPDMIVAQFELGQLFAEMGERAAATAHFAAALDIHPRFSEAWFALAEELERRDVSPADPLRKARDALKSGRRSEAAAAISDLLAREPANAAARFLQAALLLASDRAAAAANEIAPLVERDPVNVHYRSLEAAALYASEDFSSAADAYNILLRLAPDRPGTWMSYGRALKAIGRKEEAVAAFRKALLLNPALGDAWRTLASVNGFQFEAAEVKTLRDCLAHHELRASNRMQLQFALAKAEEGAGNYGEAFAQYEASNSLQKAASPFDARGPTAFVRQAAAMYSQDFFRSRDGAGSPSRGPIFIVGLPRSGTTLVEQIISSHPAVEGMEELPFLGMVAARVANTREGQTIDSYLGHVPMLGRERFRELGEYYLELVRARRKSARPFFADKMPNNFLHIGLAHLVLPNAPIIDVRRNPLDCCLSCFTSYFAFPQPFAHSLSDLGHYYGDYVALMDHYDRVLPGRIHRVIYDDLVADPEREIRKLLAFAELDFDARCLRFHENERTVRTLSAEQVRRPMYAGSVGAWRRYEPWLGPLKSALGDVQERWRGGPSLLSRV